MNRFEYFKGLEPDKAVGEIDKFIKDWHDMADGTYNDKTKMLITFLVYLSEERLPLCPFKCEGCAREVEVEDAGAYWISPISFSPATRCFLQEDMFDTKEEAIEAWKKAVSK